LPEFDVTVLTVRSGTQTLRVEADDVVAARALVHSECGEGRCHCPPEWCTDDVESMIVSVSDAEQGPTQAVDPNGERTVSKGSNPAVVTDCRERG
jgi:hypothetical protein